MKSGVLPWEKVYLFSKRSSRAAWYGGMYTKEKIRNHDLIWSNINDILGTKKGKMWFASMGKKRPWPTWKCWLLMKKGNPKENKKILMSLPQTILCRAQLPWQWGAEPYSGWWQARQPFPHSKCRGRCLWLWLQQPNLHAQPWSLLRLRTSFYLCSQRYSKRRGGKDEKNLEQLCIPVNSYLPFSVARRLCYLWISCLVFGSV